MHEWKDPKLEAEWKALCDGIKNVWITEGEGSNHPDYKFQVVIKVYKEFPNCTEDSPTGKRLLEAYECKTLEEVREKFDADDWYGTADYVSHGLIYADDYIALTLFECCYHMWHLDNGTNLRDGIINRKTSDRITETSLRRIKEDYREAEVRTFNTKRMNRVLK